MLVCLATPIAILVGSGIAALLPEVADSLNNAGAHGFSEMLYAYSSAGGNNGSAFAGFNANTVFLNVTLGLVMLFVRFVPIIGTLAIAGQPGEEKEDRHHSGHPVHLQRDVCLPADPHRAAGGRAQLLPGAVAGAHC